MNAEKPDSLSGIIESYIATGILYPEWVRECRKRFIVEVLKRNKFNQCKAAKELGMHRNTLSRTLGELKIIIAELRSPHPRKRVQPAAGLLTKAAAG